MRDRVTDPYKTTGKITVLHNLILIGIGKTEHSELIPNTMSIFHCLGRSKDSVLVRDPV